MGRLIRQRNREPFATLYRERPPSTNPVKNRKEIKADENFRFATVERFGHWYRARGQGKKAGIHSSKMRWWLFTRDKKLALKTAKARIE
ncbi:hypothetical protein [Desulfurivibrio dismutans]|uniref:hypothetical protein n=1 Tax=Desulfurivibrio dismutans TaxID=1398908 RepID=UPI0023DBF509|nr:hypothetical protein [Desulfurivibrio alkaliphilus]MDF1614066.1 hypothetical protein [Desulfurivibrio alkaliphilus]